MLNDVMLKYLNTRHAAMEALLDRDVMERVLATVPEQIVELDHKLHALPSKALDGMPHTPNPKAGENRIIALITAKTIQEQRLTDAKHYQAWFIPAWEGLSESDRDILETWYCSGLSGYQASLEVAERYQITRKTACNKKDNALKRLALALYGV